jgi:hypothetical protein
MHRFSGGLLSISLLCGVASAQADMKSRLLPITAPIRHAGVYHVATGTWTRGATLANTPQRVIYDNTCTSIYFTPMLSTERFQHRSRIPSPSGPTTGSIFYGTSSPAHSYDELPGCADRYTVSGFEIGYCSKHAGTVDWEHQFASSWAECGASDMVPQYTITLTGLPGGTPTGGFNCWAVDVDLSGLPNGGIEISADGDGSYQGPSTLDQFGWSFGLSSPTLPSDLTGPIIAGNFTWTGTNFCDGCIPCTGADGTIWDSSSAGAGPVPAYELEGTGMSSSDFFRDAGGPVSGASGAGCYSYGVLHSDFYSRFFSATACGGSQPSLVPFCAAGVGGIVTCPCGNPQVPAGATKGCDNFAGGGTGGAVLSGFGSAVVSWADSLELDINGGIGNSVTVLFQGTANVANARSGAGVRCVNGNLKRLYKRIQLGGRITFPDYGPPVHEASAAMGYTIVPPITLYYYAAYRNTAANGQPGCPGLDFGFNTTNAGAVSWAP